MPAEQQAQNDLAVLQPIRKPLSFLSECEESERFSDRHLVQQAQSGDTDAFSALVDRYQTPAQRVAQSILGNGDDAADAVQDAWILALRRVETLREPARFGGWFYRIVANVALRKRQRRAADARALEHVYAFIALDATAPQRETHYALLPLALNALSDRDHIVIALHYFSHVPIATIARLLGIPQGTVKSRLHHGRQVLRKELLQMATEATGNAKTRADHIPADFRTTIHGMGGAINWETIFAGDFAGWSAEKQPIVTGVTPDHWEAVGSDGLVGENDEGGTILTYGDADWADVELSLLITPLGGGNAQVFFRMDGANQRFYCFDMMMGWQAVAVRRVTLDAAGNSENIRLSVVDYPLAHGREYAVSIAARGHSITTYIDGALVNQVTDGEWLNGQIGLNVWAAKTLYRDIRVRSLS